MINKIITIATSLIGIAAFFLGKNSGKNKQKNEQLKKENEELVEDIKYISEANNMSFNDKSSFLFIKDRNDKDQ